MSGDIQVVDHLFNNDTSVVFATRDGVLYIAYFGASLGDVHIDASVLSRGVMGGGLDTEVVPGVFPLPSQGWTGLPGLEASCHGKNLPLNLTCSFSFAHHKLKSSSAPALVDNASSFALHDEQHGVSIDLIVRLDSSNALVMSARITNTGDTPLTINAASLCIPVGSHAGVVLTLGGRHAMEAVQQRTPWERSKVSIENRTGRTSHEQLGVVFAGTPGFTEQRGDVWGVHLAWSGNFRIQCDGITETLKTIHVGELLQPNELVLEPTESYSVPDVVASFSTAGLSGASQNFHRHVRSIARTNKRPVVLNTWEAVYFKHNLDTLKDLATAAADVGVERFVLDDGWFHGRRNDTAGLGDWWVDSTVWPDGLSPLISHVTSLGMDFGLWFEPEMVNPNSDLYRTHPEWALDGSVMNPLLGRNQLVLNLSHADVREYLFDKINTLLSQNNIAYVKWDHNRPLVGGASHAQTAGFYELLERLTTAHPTVQFESCASGGGRIDMGVAKYVKRFWASDSIDALDRLEIQKGLTTFIPPEMLGSHIGSPVCHTTGRKHALSFRAATALFGWLGVEWNVSRLMEKERDGLRHVIAFYKEHRDLLHSGNFYRVDHPDDTIDIRGVLSDDGSEGLFSVSRLRSGPSNHSAPLRLPVDGLFDYRVSIVQLGSPRWALHRQLPQWVRNGTTDIDARVLGHIGLPMPSLLPESSFLIRLERVVSS